MGQKLRLQTQIKRARRLGNERLAQNLENELSFLVESRTRYASQRAARGLGRRKEGTETYTTVRPGEGFLGLAERTMGSPQYAAVLAQMNNGIDRLYSGMQVYIPDPQMFEARLSQRNFNRLAGSASGFEGGGSGDVNLPDLPTGGQVPELPADASASDVLSAFNANRSSQAQGQLAPGVDRPYDPGPEAVSLTPGGFQAPGAPQERPFNDIAREDRFFAPGGGNQAQRGNLGGAPTGPDGLPQFEPTPDYQFGDVDYTDLINQTRENYSVFQNRGASGVLFPPSPLADVQSQIPTGDTSGPGNLPQVFTPEQAETARLVQAQIAFGVIPERVDPATVAILYGTDATREEIEEKIKGVFALNDDGSLTPSPLLIGEMQEKLEEIREIQQQELQSTPGGAYNKDPFDIWYTNVRGGGGRRSQMLLRSGPTDGARGSRGGGAFIPSLSGLFNWRQPFS